MDTQNIQEVHARIAPYIHRTPVLTSTLIDEMSGAQLFFKCENFQKMGAFKMRGASNAILSLSKTQQQKGVVTHSSGNFAQALALAAKHIGVPAYIVMPENAPSVKKAAVAAYGGNIIECESTPEARERKAEEVRISTGATFLHPSNDDAVIAGQGTAALELLTDVPNLDCIVAPVGGGGLIAGTVLAVRQMAMNCKVIGAEPAKADDAYRSLQSGKIEFNESVDTIADGLRTFLGDRNFPIIRSGVQQIIRVEDDEIIKAMKLIFERMKIIVEPSSAITLAAILKSPDVFRNKRVGILISGGNVDLSNLPFADDKMLMV